MTDPVSTRYFSARGFTTFSRNSACSPSGASREDTFQFLSSSYSGRFNRKNSLPLFRKKRACSKSSSGKIVLLISTWQLRLKSPFALSSLKEREGVKELIDAGRICLLIKGSPPGK